MYNVWFVELLLILLVLPFIMTLKVEENNNVNRHDTLNLSVLCCYNVSPVATPARPENEVVPATVPLFVHCNLWFYRSNTV